MEMDAIHSENKPTVTDTELLRQVLRLLSRPQLEDICLHIPAGTPMGDALSARIDLWCRDENTEEESLRESILNELSKSDNFSKYFYTELRSHLDKANITDAELYKAVGLAQSQWSKNQTLADSEVGKPIWTSHTKRDTVLKMAIVLKLNLFELKNLMAYGGHAFSPGVNSRDYVIATCIRRGEYNPRKINDILEAGGLEYLDISLPETGIDYKLKQRRTDRNGNDSE